jgi:hypothetical protein
LLIRSSTGDSLTIFSLEAIDTFLQLLMIDAFLQAEAADPVGHPR